MDGIDLESTISRAKFDDLNMDYFVRCMEILGQCLEDAKMDRGSIDEVVLVGGSTRIVKIQQMLRDFFHGKKALCEDLDADEAVACGAAIHAAELGGVAGRTFNDIVLRDVTPLSLGTANYLGGMEVLIPRNTPVPASKDQFWSLAKDYLTSTTYPIYEGERTSAKDNNRLGELHLSGITPAPAGKAKIRVTFGVDHDGILNVSAQDMASGNIAATTIRNEHGRPSRGEMERMIRDSLKFKSEDEKWKRKADARGELEGYIRATRNRLRSSSSSGSRMPMKKKQQVMERALERAMEWSEKGGPSLDEDDYRKKKKELEDLWSEKEERVDLWSHLKRKLHL